MSRNFRNFLWFCLGFLGIGLPMMAFAETISATYGDLTKPLYYVKNNGQGNTLDPVEACGTYAGDPHVVIEAERAKCFAGTSYFVNNLPGTCYPYTDASYSIYWTSPSTPVCRAVGYSCPATGGWTLSGSTCSRADCALGETHDADGLCVSQCSANQYLTEQGTCADKCPSGQYAGETSTSGALTQAAGGGTMPATVCAQNGSYWCTVPTGGLGMQIGSSWVTDIGKMTGSTCDPGSGGIGSDPIQSGDPSDLPATPSRIDGPAAACAAAGMEWGTVNNVVTCVSPGPNTQVKSSSSTSSSTTNASGTTTTNTTSNTTCQGDQCTTTTTTSNPADPNATTTTTTTTNKSEFCEKNPKSSQCAGGGGGEQSAYCLEHPMAVQCMESGTPGEEGGLEEKSVGPQSITPVAIGGAGGCPADVQLPKGTVMTWAPACQFAEGMRPVVLIVAWLSAGLIVLGMGRP